MPDRVEEVGAREMVGGPWFDGEIRADSEIRVHVLTGRDWQTGLGVARCGLRQESRSNGWYYLDPENAYQAGKIASGEWPVCTECML